MKTLFPAIAVIALVGMILTGCVSKPVEPERKLSYGTVATEALNGASIPLEVGQQLEVRLPSNRSAGYQWVQTEPLRGMLRDTSPRYEVPPAPEGSTARAGIGGTEIFLFAAARPGTQILTFEYRRSWETGNEAEKKIQYQVIVN